MCFNKYTSFHYQPVYLMNNFTDYQRLSLFKMCLVYLNNI